MDVRVALYTLYARKVVNKRVECSILLLFAQFRFSSVYVSNAQMFVAISC